MSATHTATVERVYDGLLQEDEQSFLLDNDQFVKHYPCLPWEMHSLRGGVPARASLSHAIAVRAFLLRHTLGADTATNAASTRSPLTVLLTGAAWSRWLPELASSGLLNTTCAFFGIRDADLSMAAIPASPMQQL